MFEVNKILGIDTVFGERVETVGMVVSKEVVSVSARFADGSTHVIIFDMNGEVIEQVVNQVFPGAPSE